jgi:hypothetical protein
MDDVSLAPLFEPRFEIRDEMACGSSDDILSSTECRRVAVQLAVSHRLQPVLWLRKSFSD